MAILSAENKFKRGLLAIVDENYGEASRCFRQAIDIQELRASDRPDWRYLSYYGLSIAKAFHADGEAIEACRVAAHGNTINPELYLNLGRVYRLAGKHTLAAEAFGQGLELEPKHSILREEMRLLEVTVPIGIRGSRARAARSVRWTA